MITLYLVRHGETDGNVKRWYQGATDIPLNARGREQAEALGRYFQDFPFQAIYSSPLSRAKETAEIVARPHGLTVWTYEALREIDFGAWEGHTYEEIRELWPGEIEAFYRSDGMMKARGGESFCDVAQRTVEQIHRLMEHHADGDKVLIASHGAAIRCMLFGLLGLELSRIWCFQQYNTAFNVVEYYGERSVATLINCTNHLVGTSGCQTNWTNTNRL